jgi:cell pole-organizing protein PopZ
MSQPAKAKDLSPKEPPAKDASAKDTSAKDASAKEPSMEEILASIRRIIADDDAAKAPKAEPKTADVTAPPPPNAAAARPAPPAQPPPAAAAIAAAAASPAVDLDAMLDDIEEVADAAAPDVLDLTESMAAPAPPTQGFRTIDAQSDIVFDDGPMDSEPRPTSSQDARRSGLMSDATSAAVDSAFNALAQTVLVHNARTLEDLVREMLRPLLQTWLDDNLPNLVERLVRAEIERVARGRG